MSTKKRFGLSPDLASGIRNTIQSASTNSGQLHYDMIALDVIEPDPHNPRKLTITRKDLVDGISSADPKAKLKQTELEALLTLAESIKQVGVRSAIEVYKDTNGYRIMTGERRYLASLLAGQKYIPARINDKPEEFKLRYTQWIENINRQDLNLWEKYLNLKAIAKAYQKQSSPPLTAEAIKQMLGVSMAQAYRYLALLNMDPPIAQLVEAGRLNNLKLVEKIMAMKDKAEQAKLIAQLNAGTGEITALPFLLGSLPDQAQTAAPISLGKLRNLHAAKYIIHTLLSDVQLAKYRHLMHGIDWQSSDMVNKAIKKLIKKIEKEVVAEEAV